MAAGVMMVAASVAAAAAGPAGAGHATGPASEASGPGGRPGTPSLGQASRQPGPPPAVSTSPQDAAARSRMHECGHQWANIKRAGNAGVMTWKEFSATCLVTR